MYQIDSVKQSVTDALGFLTRTDWETEHDTYPGKLGTLSAYVTLATITLKTALENVERLQSLMGDVDIYILTDCHKQPSWTLAVPTTIPLTCPQCQVKVDCDITQDHNPELLDAESSHGALIDTDSCEDCRKKLCPHCERFPHPGDSDLIQCAECHAQIKEAANA